MMKFAVPCRPTTYRLSKILAGSIRGAFRLGVLPSVSQKYFSVAAQSVPAASLIRSISAATFGETGFTGVDGACPKHPAAAMTREPIASNSRVFILSNVNALEVLRAIYWLL